MPSDQQYDSIPSPNVFDAFISYNSADRAEVEPIAMALQKRNLRIWFDKDLLPGMDFIQEMQNGIKNSKKCLVFVGPNKMGPWQTPEMEVSLVLRIKAKKDVIPVLLPGVLPNDERIPLFLTNLVSVVFKERVDDEEQLARLQWAITGINPISLPDDTAPANVAVAVKVQDPVQAALEDLRAGFGNDSISFFIGRCAPNTISQCDISRELLLKINLIKEKYESLLPPLDLAASYFAFENTDGILDENVKSILNARSGIAPSVYDELAELLKISSNRAPKRGQRRHKQLVITSNIDTLLERALLLNGVAFTRLVQYRTGKQIDIFEYAGVTKLKDGSLSVQSKADTPTAIPSGDRATMLAHVDGLLADQNYAIDLKLSRESGPRAKQLRQISLDDLTEPILFKLYGSHDVPRSAVFSRDQHFDFASSMEDQRIVPMQIEAIISNTPIIYLGCRIIDPDFQWSDMLLRKPLTDRPDDVNKYMVHRREAGDERDCGHKVESKAWENISRIALSKYKIRMLDCDIEDFLKQLRVAISGP